MSNPAAPRSGGYIELPKRSDPQDHKVRYGGLFTPEAEELPEQPPQAITHHEDETTAPIDLQQLTATAIPGLRLLISTIGLLLLSLLLIDLAELSISLWQRHWSLGALVGTLSTLMLFSALYMLWSWRHNRDKLTTLTLFQQQCEELMRHQSQSRGDKIFRLALEELTLFYAGKPHLEGYQRALDSAPDYLNDRELIHHLDLNYFQKLDSVAQQLINRSALQAGVAVGLSQWASTDALLTLWNNMRMLEQVAKIYGIRPSLRNKMTLLGRVILNIGFSYSSQIAADHLSMVISAGIMPKAISSVAQGITSALFTKRIGLIAIKLCRPVPRQLNDESELRQTASQVVKRLLTAYRKVG
ncbi:MAG: DUF697 domain-containing protein [Gammaproteobacteria bacterium]|nr:DUF697 domain-containing protein [Gammaproteobacteria bacterium]